MAYDEPLRPQLHFTAKQNWLNDPNGLVYYEGRYHLFFQHNPTGNTWGNMSWGHAVSTDLLHWTELPVAITADGGGAIFSGSAVVDTNNTSGFGRDGRPPLVAVYTEARPGNQSQALAYSNDGGLSFTKYAGNPVLDIGSAEFRDPKVFWYAPADEWRMVVVRALDKQVVIYGSPDLKRWKELSAFGPAGAVGGAWECPDLFPLSLDGDPAKVKWVMAVSLSPGGIAGGSGMQYFVGSFDGTTFTPDDGGDYRPPAGAVLQDFEAPDFGSWTSSGSAFDRGPIAGTVEGQQSVTGFAGSKLVNSFTAGDRATGTLASPELIPNNRYLNFLVGGGRHPHQDGTQPGSAPPEGTLLFEGFESPGGSDLAATGWRLTGDFEPELNPSTVGGEGYLGARRLNTYEGGRLGDDNRGTLTSPPFLVSDDHVSFLLGGGRRTDGSLQVELVVDGRVVDQATGNDSGLLNWRSFDLRAHQGKQASLRIIDEASGPWGHLTFDHVVLGPQPARPASVETAVNLLVDGQVVRTATGADSEQLDWVAWDLSEFRGRPVRIQVVDHNIEGWGHILADQFTLADAPAASATQRARWLDHGRDFYAGVTFNDVPDGRRLMVAWMSNWQYANNTPTDPWRSAMTLPRELTLRTIEGEPRLISAPVAAVRSLRRPGPYRLTPRRLPIGVSALTDSRAAGDAVEIKATFRVADAERFGIRVRSGSREHTVVGYDAVHRRLYLDRTRSGALDFSPDFASVETAPLRARNGRISLRIIVDRSSVEVFADSGRRSITDQIFPATDSRSLSMFSEGGRAEVTSLTVWQLRSTWR